MRIVLGAAVLTVLLGSLVPSLRRSARARSSAIFVLGLAIVFEGIVGLNGGSAWLDVTILVGVVIVAVGVRSYRLAAARGVPRVR